MSANPLIYFQLVTPPPSGWQSTPPDTIIYRFMAYVAKI